MNKPERHPKEDNDNNGNKSRLFPEGFFDISRRVYDSQQRTNNQNEENNQQPHALHIPKQRGIGDKIKLCYYRWWVKVKRDRRIELLLTAAITFFAAVQLWMIISNNESTGRQTDQLISAAKISA